MGGALIDEDVSAQVETLGRTLIEVKARLGHGRFLAWIEREFAWSERTALRFMQVAGAFGDKSATVADLAADRMIDMGAIYALAAPSTPEAARAAAIAAAQGESFQRTGSIGAGMFAPSCKHWGERS